MKKNNCVKSAEKVSKSTEMKQIDKLFNYYIEGSYFGGVDITAMKFFRNISDMVNTQNFRGSLVTLDELSYLNQLDCINLFLDDNVLKIIINSDYHFIQKRGTEFEFVIDGLFLDDIKGDFTTQVDNKLLNNYYV